MTNVIKTGAMFGIILLAVGCSLQQDVIYRECDIEDTDTGVKITCGTEEHYIDNGQNGIAGTNGILGVFDPCGDGPGVDEVILKLNTGDYLAWYKHAGLFLLQEDIIYRTTDAQKCKFKILAGNILEVY